MIIYDEMKSPTLLKLWWEKMSQDVANSYPIVDFSLIDNKFKMNTCVDIGCNVGAFSLVASERFKSVVSFDYCKNKAKSTRRKEKYSCL